jgi:hypothetical protein
MKFLSGKHDMRPPELASRLRDYWTTGFDSVEGWVHPDLIGPLETIQAVQSESKVKGGALEIGLHHGKFFIPLALLLRAGETAVGLDVFEDQEKNLDHSGLGDHDRVQRNIDRYCRGVDVMLLKRDSLSLNSKDRVHLVDRCGPFRLISIDGGHTPVHAMNDLQFSQDVMQSGGVIILDDFVNAHWPGVMEGVARLFEHHAPKIAPFAWGLNKLFLTDLTYQRVFLDAFNGKFAGTAAFKRVTLWHYDVVVF